MKNFALAIIVAFSAAANVGATCDGWYCDLVGIYFDEDGQCALASLPPMVPVPAYLIFSNMRSATINAWEIKLEMNQVIMLNFEERNQHVTVSPLPGEYMCGLATPQVVTGGMYIAADMTIMMPHWGAGYIAGDGVRFHLMDDEVPCYTDEHDVAYALRAIFSDWNGEGLLCGLGVDHPCLVAAQGMTFGAVKSLFR